MKNKTLLPILTIAIFLVSGRGYSQELRTLKGQILSEGSSPVPGLAVIHLGTENAVVTDLNGKFELTVEGQGDVFVHLFGLDLEIYLKYEQGETTKTVYLKDWKQLKRSNRKIGNEWTARNRK